MWPHNGTLSAHKYICTYTSTFVNGCAKTVMSVYVNNFGTLYSTLVDMVTREIEGDAVYFQADFATGAKDTHLTLLPVTVSSYGTLLATDVDCLLVCVCVFIYDIVYMYDRV